MQEKETQVKFTSGLSANRPSNNWAQEIFQGCLKLGNVVQDQVELKTFYSEWKNIMGRVQGKLKNVKPHSFSSFSFE